MIISLVDQKAKVGNGSAPFCPVNINCGSYESRQNITICKKTSARNQFLKGIDNGKDTTWCVGSYLLLGYADLYLWL